MPNNFDNKNRLMIVPSRMYNVRSNSNVSYRHVLHVMKQFCEVGILKKENSKGYQILDFEHLKNLLEEA